MACHLAHLRAEGGGSRRSLEPLRDCEWLDTSMECRPGVRGTGRDFEGTAWAGKRHRSRHRLKRGIRKESGFDSRRSHATT